MVIHGKAKRDGDGNLSLLREAETSWKLQKAELERAEGDLKAARRRKENPAHLEAELADAESLLAKAETALAQLPFLIRSSQARLDYAQQNLEGKQAAKDAIAAGLIPAYHAARAPIVGFLRQA